MDKKVAYPYENADGKIVFTKYKVLSDDGSKKYFIDPKPEDGTKPLYHYPDIIRSVSAGAPVFITEGEKDVETLRSMGFTATCTFDGGGRKWREEYNQNFLNADVFIISDIDKPGQEYASQITSNLKKVAKRVTVIDVGSYGIDLPENGDVTDLCDAVGFEKVKEWLDGIIMAPENSEAAEVHYGLWYKPESFQNVINPPTFQTEWLPQPICDYVRAIAANTQVAPEMVASIVLAVISFITSKKFAIHLRHGWFESANLFFLIVAKSGERKSAVMRTVSRPLIRYQQLWNERHAQEIKESAAEYDLLKKEYDRLKKRANKDEQAKIQLDEVRQALANHKILRPKRFVADDVTIEKTASIMQENEGKLMILSAENTFLQTVTGRYSNAPNYDLVLKGYSCETVNVDRVSRRSEVIENATLTICVTTQPIVAEKFYGNDEFACRGLLARFLMCKPESKIGSRSFDVPPVDEGIRKMWYNLCFTLLNRVFHQEKGVVVELDDEAKLLFRDIFENVEQGLEESEIEEFDSKFSGHVGRLALILHLCHNPTDEEKVSAHTVKCAYEIGKFYREHLLAMYINKKCDQTTQTAMNILRKLRKNSVTYISQRDLGRMMQNITEEDRAKEIQLLVDKGWLRQTQSPDHKVGRKHSPVYEVNPLLHKDRLSA